MRPLFALPRCLLGFSLPSIFFSPVLVITRLLSRLVLLPPSYSLRHLAGCFHPDAPVIQQKSIHIKISQVRNDSFYMRHSPY